MMSMSKKIVLLIVEGITEDIALREVLSDYQILSQK